MVKTKGAGKGQHRLHPSSQRASVLVPVVRPPSINKKSRPPNLKNLSAMNSNTDTTPTTDITSKALTTASPTTPTKSKHSNPKSPKSPRSPPTTRPASEMGFATPTGKSPVSPGSRPGSALAFVGNGASLPPQMPPPTSPLPLVPGIAV